MTIDPRISILLLISSFLLILISSNLYLQIGIIILYLLFYYHKTPIRQIVKIMFFLVLPTLIIVALNWIFVSKDVNHISLMVLRFWGITWLFNWFMKQVNPDDLAKALWSLHLPYNVAWQISLAYRFLPMFQEESRRIYEIQAARGIPLDQGYIKKIRYLPSMSIPLLVMTQDKANLLAETLFARNWNSHTPKTVLNPLKMQLVDWSLLFLIPLSLGAIIYFL